MTTTKSGGGARDLRIKVKKPAKRSHSSQLWLERQLNDPYVAAAQREGRRAEVDHAGAGL